MLQCLYISTINHINSNWKRYSDYFNLAVWPLDLEYFPGFARHVAGTCSQRHLS